MKILNKAKKATITIVLTMFLASLFFVFTSPQTVFGKSSDSGTKSFDDIIQLYGLRDAVNIPPEIKPLQFSSPKDLESFLISMQRSKNSAPHFVLRETAKKDSNFSPMTTSYGIVTKNCSVSVALGTYFNTWGDIRVATSGSFRWIDSVVSTYTGLTGVTLGFDLTNPYSYSYNKTASSVSIKGGGIVNAYILIDGFIKIYSSPVSCSFTYSVY
ncbi:MAG: hypothetical protein ABFD24_03690 [Anaerolineaceae bacterium]